MVVFMVIHDDGDYESQLAIRGVFATRELAEQVVTLDETGVYPATDRSGETLWRRSHSDLCCSVEETLVETTLPTPFVLNPERPARAGSFVPKEWTFEMIAALHAPATRR